MTLAKESTLAPPLLTLRDVSRLYGGPQGVRAVTAVNLQVRPGEFVALMGPSGCGKSTLLHLCGAMDRPTEGTIELDGRALARLTDDELARARRERVGFVFQFFNLLPTLTLWENVALPLLLAGHSSSQAEARARAALGRLNLARRADAFPSQVSGGEMQRAALARAMVHRPALLVADEPTGNLDSAHGREVLDLLVELNTMTKVTVLLATHDADVARAARRVLRMRDGRLLAEEAGSAIPPPPSRHASSR